MATRRWTGHEQRCAPRLRLLHKDAIAVAVLRPGEAEPDERTIANTPEALRTLIRQDELAFVAPRKACGRRPLGALSRYGPDGSARNTKPRYDSRPRDLAAMRSSAPGTPAAAHLPPTHQRIGLPFSVTGSRPMQRIRPRPA